MRRERVLGCRPGRLRPSAGCGAPMGEREADCLLDDAIDSKGDLNAAVNILSAGLAVRACGDSRLTEATLR